VAVSTKTKVKMIHPDWDEEAIAAEVALVQAESGAMVPDIGPLAEYGGNGQGSPENLMTVNETGE
jgi:hypothetical protein